MYFEIKDQIKIIAALSLADKKTARDNGISYREANLFESINKITNTSKSGDYYFNPKTRAFMILMPPSKDAEAEDKSGKPKWKYIERLLGRGGRGISDNEAPAEFVAALKKPEYYKGNIIEAGTQEIKDKIIPGKEYKFRFKEPDEEQEEEDSIIRVIFERVGMSRGWYNAGSIFSHINEPERLYRYFGPEYYYKFKTPEDGIKYNAVPFSRGNSFDGGVDLNDYILRDYIEADK
jgi:hypothetical protein